MKMQLCSFTSMLLIFNWFSTIKTHRTQSKEYDNCSLFLKNMVITGFPEKMSFSEKEAYLAKGHFFGDTWYFPIFIKKFQ